MRKIIFALIVVILAAPAWADIAIIVEELGTGQAGINYSGTELARAFALDITVDRGIIDAISDFAVGDDNNGYGIFPANFSRYITVDSVIGEVDDWSDSNYTPVADINDPGALGGLGTPGITIEMASLYDTKAPPLEGRLCVITVSEPCMMTVTTNATRGNVVLEDGTEATVDLSNATDILIAAPPLFYTGLQPEEWWTVGRPNCWCAWINPRQCHGDANGKSQGKKKYWVSTDDLDILIAAWNKPFEEIDGKKLGDVPLICADFNQLPQGKKKYRVSTEDLDILVVNWNIANKPDPNCP
ncbi:MAG: hypothetical protein ACYTFW_23795 [Planctomycetota bacterium]|jgi:hypothetical protein